MSTDIILTERQQREKFYYDQYASTFDVTRKIDTAPVEFKESRPWNSYWSVYELAAKFFKPGSIMLDFGSGPGDNAFRFSQIGYRIEGFDISESNVAISRLIFDKNNLSNIANFQVAPAESLPYANDQFDFIAGIDILHHVDIEQALVECRRVLKPGGVSVFREPVEVPFLDMIRNTWLVKLIAPKKTSFELHITEDERKLSKTDIATIQRIFPNTVLRQSFLFARFDKFFRAGSDPKPSVLEKLDYFLMNKFPLLKSFGGVVIFVSTKE